MAANILYGSKTRSTLHRHAALQAGAYVLFLARHLYEPWAWKHYMSMELYPAINREHSALLSPTEKGGMSVFADKLRPDKNASCACRYLLQMSLW